MENTRSEACPKRAPTAVLALALLLAGCGQSGPLYLPDEPPRTVPEPADTAPPADAEDEDDGAGR